MTHEMREVMLKVRQRSRLYQNKDILTNTGSKRTMTVIPKNLNTDFSITCRTKIRWTVSRSAFRVNVLLLGLFQSDQTLESDRT